MNPSSDSEDKQKDPVYPVFRAALVVVFMLGVFTGCLICYSAILTVTKLLEVL